MRQIVDLDTLLPTIVANLVQDSVEFEVLAGILYLKVLIFFRFSSSCYNYVDHVNNYELLMHFC